MKYFVDTWSRVDSPPVSELRRTSDRKLVMELERADISALLAGWRPPEVFMTTGRDGKTDIWGIIHRPVNFDPAKKYPVVESIYAGPQGSFVPKSFGVYTQPLTELGFIVVQIDGMGTNNRSKAFHDVAWKNLADAGFPDRILWHKAVAAKYAYYDLSHVGIFGTSAGGQNSLGALLFHPDFYKVAVSNSGCHDNRMDKIWWNEHWMGWPIGPPYSDSGRIGHQCRPVFYDAGRERADQSEQEIRSACGPRRRSWGRWRLRPEAPRGLFRSSSARCRTAGLEQDRNSFGEVEETAVFLVSLVQQVCSFSFFRENFQHTFPKANKRHSPP
jgi:hypothetical protein